MNPKAKRLGKVIFDLSYVVDLDDADMVDHAKECIYEDIMSAYKYDEVQNYIEVTEPDKTLKESDIPQFLLPEETHENQNP
jgi:hypothetical protein